MLHNKAVKMPTWAQIQSQLRNPNNPGEIDSCLLALSFNIMSRYVLKDLS